jgi:hypothetical protein
VEWRSSSLPSGATDSIRDRKSVNSLGFQVPGVAGVIGLDASPISYRMPLVLEDVGGDEDVDMAFSS